MGPYTTRLLKSRSFWNRLGYVLTAGWIIFVLLMTNGDGNAPLFDTIFLVPLGVWLVILIVRRRFEDLERPIR